MKKNKIMFQLLALVSLLIGIGFTQRPLSYASFMPIQVQAREEEPNEKKEEKEEDKNKEKEEEKEEDKNKEKEAQTEEEKALEKVDEENESPLLHVTEDGQLQVQTTGADLQTDIYVVIQNQAGVERTIYVSPYRDSKNEKRISAGTYTIKDIYLLNKDYQDTYTFKHNDKLIVFPDEKVFFDIEVIEIKESKPNELLKDDAQLEAEALERESDDARLENEAETPTKTRQTPTNTTLLMGGGALVVGLVAYGVLKYFGFLDKK